MFPLLGLGALALVAFAASRSNTGQKYVAQINTSLKKAGSGRSLISFTTRQVPFELRKRDKKTGQVRIVRGTRTQVVETPPELQLALAKKLNRPVGLDALILATVIASEESLPLGKVAIAWAVKNMARRKGKSIMSLVAPDGHFGSQQDGRYCASGQPPTALDFQIAEDVQSGKLRDPAGAIQWDSPRSQLALIKRGSTTTTRTPESVAANRRADGRRLVILPGIPAEHLRMWA